MNSGSAVSPPLRALGVGLMARLDSEHAADPGDDLRRAEGDRYPEDRAEAPTPGHSVCHCHGAERHDENDGDRREPGEQVDLQGSRAGEERRALRERRDRRPGDERGGGAPGVRRADAGEAHGGLRLAHAARACGHTRRALPTPRLEFLALPGPRRSGTEAVDDKGVVVLLLALLIGPVVGAHPRLDDELIALARVAGDRLTERAERDEPQRGDDLTRGPLFALAGIVVAHQTEARVAGVVLGRQFRVARQIADRSQRETIHRERSLCRVLGPRESAVSLFRRPMIGIAIRRLFVQKCAHAAPAPRAGVRELVYGYDEQVTESRAMSFAEA